MSSAADLKTRTVKELAEMARKRKVLGWHDMRKDELVRALARQARKAAAQSAMATPARMALCSKNGHSARLVPRRLPPRLRRAMATPRTIRSQKTVQ